jgi:exoribonuclease R
MDKLHELGLMDERAEQPTVSAQPSRRNPSFVPSGLNDDHRTDMTDQPFFAVDSVGPKEIDDAFRVRPSRLGTFSIEVAIADAGQLHTHQPLVETAIQRRWSRYGGSKRRSTLILPNNVLDELELNDDKKRRALVVSQPFNRDMEPVGDIEVLPATVRTKRLTMAALARGFAERNRRLEPIARTAESLGVATRRGERSARTAQDLTQVGSQTVRAFMIFANRSLALWANERRVPVLNRAATRLGTGSVYAYFTHQSDLHADVLESGRTLYMQGSSPLRRANDLVSMINVGVALSNKTPEYPYSPERLEEIARHLSYDKPRGNRVSVEIVEQPAAG